MNYTATITSKRQLTIPVDIFIKMGLSKGDKLVINEKNGVLEMSPARLLVERLAGSLRVPKSFQGLSDDEMIEKAKEEYFREKFRRDKKAGLL